MGYIKQNFVSGQTLKADHLNYIEDGIASIPGCDWNTMENKPFGEIKTKKHIINAEMANGSTGEWWTDSQNTIMGYYTPPKQFDVLIGDKVYANLNVSITSIVGVGNVAFFGSSKLLPDSTSSYNPYEPFVIYRMLSGGETTFVYSETDEPVKVEVYSNEPGIKQIGTEYIPDEIARKSDIPEQVIPTWEALPDKPFGEEAVKYHYLTETTVSHKALTYYNQRPSDLANTTDAIVVLDGVKYTDVPCVYQAQYQAGGFSYYVIGNPYLFDDKNPSMNYTDNGLPFCIAFFASGGTMVRVYIPNIDGEVTLELYKETGTEIKLIDEKFIPEAIARKSDITGGLDIPTYKKDEITEELAIELAKNRTVHFVLEDSSIGEVGHDRWSSEKHLVSNYAICKSSEDGCGDSWPATIEARHINDSYSGWTFDVTDEIINEIREAWNQ